MWIDRSDLHLLDFCNDFIRIAHNFPNELSGASLPLPGSLSRIYAPFSCLPGVVLLTVGQMVLLLAITTKISSVISVFNNDFHVHFWYPDYCLAFASTGLSVSTQKPNLLNHSVSAGSAVFYYFCVMVKSSHPQNWTFPPRFIYWIIPKCWPSSFPLDAHFLSNILLLASTPGLA